MNLVIDYGNTAAKVGIFKDDQLSESLTFSNMDELKFFLTSSRAKCLLVSSVNTDAGVISTWGQQIPKRFILSYQLPLPIELLYETPATLGVDRIAGACGAATLFSGKPTLVIDAGTCITYDFTDDQKKYHGGGISPGLHMRFQAMHTFTARLPLISPKSEVSLIGKSTEQSMQSGVIFGITAEMEEIIARYRTIYPELTVILCGGDARFFENRLNTSIFAIPELVLIGLNSILTHNVSL